MLTTFRSHILPPSQRRSLEELTSDLDFRHGDTRAKRSAFWTMLTISAVIASAGVLGDSTATVIGAMIIAPLSTPIMGTALAVVKRESNGSLRYLFGGVALVIFVGIAFSFWFPGDYDLLDNAQISARVRPGLFDLLAAMATGLAGAVALARKDVATVLPGVAIAISLVPPLAVVGVSIGQGEAVLAVAAFVLFLSNVVALILAGIFVFTVLGYAGESARARARTGSSLRARVVVSGLLALVLVPLAASTTLTYILAGWQSRVEQVAADWVSSVPGAAVDRVDFDGLTYTIQIRTPGEVPSTADLLARINGVVLDTFGINVATTYGEKEVVRKVTR
jgi:uncharacterized hydrophobic protein (TIGR00271 family)